MKEMEKQQIEVEVKETQSLEEEFENYGRCTGGGCAFCKYSEICPTGQMMGGDIL